MQILKRRTKFKQILELILGFCYVIVLVGCSLSEEDSKESLLQEDILKLENRENDYREQKVRTIEETAIYSLDNEKLEKVGSIAENIYLNIQDSDAVEGKIPLITGRYYLDAETVELSTRQYQEKVHLIPYNVQVITKESYDIEDIDGNRIMRMSKAETYPVVVQPSKKDPRWGVLFQNDLVYISIENGEYTKDNFLEEPTINQSVPVLMYHFFYNEDNDEKRVDGNYVEVKEFDEQLSKLKEEGYTFLTMIEIYYFMEGRAQIPEKSIAITIDDGDASVYKYAYPILKKYDIPATLFLIGGWLEPNLSYEFIEMREAGIELQSHGFLMHQGGCEGMGHGGRLQCVDLDIGVQDTRQSLDYVDGGFVYCYPFGDVNQHAKEILKQTNVKMAFTTEQGKISPGMDLYALPRIRVTGGVGIVNYMNRLK